MYLVCLGVEAVPVLPAINTNNVVIVTNSPYNAVGDGVTDNTLAISNAIVKAAAGGLTNGNWGGTVEIPGPGTYLCGPLTLKSSVNLQVNAGATLMMLPMASWPNASTPFIFGTGLTNLEFSGNGTIDGQGAAWWGPPTAGTRPNFIQIDKSQRILFQNLTLQNPPTFTIYLKNGDSDVTLQGININTVSTSPNTDGMDIGSTNMLIANSHISDGDDNIELGGSSYPAAWITITNCVFGYGHGVSVGSDINGNGSGVHDVTVINCAFTNTQNGIKLKSDNDRGGPVYNMFYYNLSMTNLAYAPILFYSYYNTYGADATDKGITPAVAASASVAAITTKEPAYHDLIVSNLIATSAQPGMIWARTEFPATNITLTKLNITSTDATAGNGSFAIYNARGVTVSDSIITVASGRNTFELFDAQVTFSNRATGGSAISLEGLSVTNPLAFYNQNASLNDGTFFDATLISLGGCTVSNGTALTLAGTTPVNFSLGTNAATLSVAGNLSLSSPLNISTNAGFGPGTHRLFNYTGSLSGTPVLGTVPAGYNYSLSTATAGQVNLVVTQPAPPAPTNLIATATNLQINLKWNSVSGATGYNLKRGTVSGNYPTIFSGLTATNYADANVTNAVNYFYVVSAVAGGESPNSLQASAAPLPSNHPTNLVSHIVGGQLQLSWPLDHLGWRLQIQTNTLNAGLSTNWATVENSTNLIATNLMINRANPAVFLRLIYP